MQRIKDGFLDAIETVVPLGGLSVLDIGCGTGGRTVLIGKRCVKVVAIEPDPSLIEVAKSQNASENIDYLVGSAENIPTDSRQFDVVLFTLSFHHVPAVLMSRAVDEAVRVVKRNGYIIFFEPAEDGSFFEAEIAFDACDGDERKEKASAYRAMKAYGRIQEIAELFDETILQFDSLDDFMDSMKPKGGSEKVITEFLEKNDYRLNAERRINIFQVKK